MPGEEHTYTSRRIPLTLEQMKAIDLGGPIRVVVEDFTYGVDELFYQDAVNAGVLVAMEDGTDDGDEAIDTYLIPTWGDETVLDVLARYFPHTTDADGNLIAIWTPEYRSDTPAWCVEPRVVGTGSQRTLWCKHALSTADWWNVYTNGLGDGTRVSRIHPLRLARWPSSASTRTATWTATATAPRSAWAPIRTIRPTSRSLNCWPACTAPAPATTSWLRSPCSTPVSTTPTASKR